MCQSQTCHGPSLAKPCRTIQIRQQQEGRQCNCLWYQPILNYPKLWCSHFGMIENQQKVWSRQRGYSIHYFIDRQGAEALGTDLTLLGQTNVEGLALHHLSYHTISKFKPLNHQKSLWYAMIIYESSESSESSEVSVVLLPPAFSKRALRCISVTALVASSGELKQTKPKPWGRASRGSRCQLEMGWRMDP